MSDFYTEKLRQFADLVVPFTECPFGEPISNCPFIPIHQVADEYKQIEQINQYSEEELDNLRAYHRDCMKKYFAREWKPKRAKKLKA